VLVVEKVFSKVRFISVMRVITGVFFIWDVEWPICLSGVLLLALITGKLVYSTSIVLVRVVIAFRQQIVDVIFGGK
jgi:hypothetical protein